MSGADWLRNPRGEWYVVAQIALLALVLAAPILDGRARGHGAPWLYTTAITGGSLCIAGLGFIVLGAAALGPNLSPLPAPKKDASLVESGIYSAVRHPMYSGSVLFALGWSLAWTSLAAWLATMLLLAILDIKARREEQWLEAKFAGYARYKKRVKKLIPFVY